MVLAKFGKALPASTTLADLDGFDFSSSPGYQMVPSGEERTIQIVVENGEINVYVSGGDINTPWSPSAPVAISGPPHEMTPQPSLHIRATGKAAFNIKLHGKRPGRTTVFAVSSDGILLDSLIVSVKSQWNLDYSIHILRDAIRPKDTSKERTLASLSNLLTDVNIIYKKQANINLILRNQNILTIKSDLGDPFDPNGGMSSWTKTNHKRVIDELNRGNFLNSNFINIISTWNIKDDSPSMLTLGTTSIDERVSYIERQNNGLSESQTIAHELGHALGIRGHNDREKSLMFFDKGRSGFDFISKEIDFLNDSGT